MMRLCLIFALGAAYCHPAYAQAEQQARTDVLIDYVMTLDERTLRLLQSRLLDLGHYHGQPHGIADEATFAAILAFHQQNPGPVEGLEEQIRAALADHQNDAVVDEAGALHLRRAQPAHQQQKPLCLDLPGRSDCDPEAK